MTTWRSIQCLRALAAVGVLLFHFGGVRAGEAGVDLFFVISGFIMASVVPGKTRRVSLPIARGESCPLTTRRWRSNWR